MASDVPRLLTAAEQSFLKKHNIELSEVVDARCLTGAERHALMAKTGQRYYIGSNCERAGHRLRSKRGACIQCETRNISYYRRTYEPGTVYIMGSLKMGLLKVGTSKDVDVRNRKNNWEAHGGTDDWVVIFEQRFENAGKVELDAHARLAQFNVPGSYLKDLKTVQNSRELFKCAYSIAKGAIIATREKQITREWVSPQAGQYEFGKTKAGSNG